jgi:hypothetical protein
VKPGTAVQIIFWMLIVAYLADRHAIARVPRA